MSFYFYSSKVQQSWPISATLSKFKKERCILDYQKKFTPFTKICHLKLSGSTSCVPLKFAAPSDTYLLHLQVIGAGAIPALRITTWK